MNDFWGQFRTEWLHATFVALQYGVLGLGTVLWWRYRRTVLRVEKSEAERGLKAESKNDERDDALRRHAEELSDIKRVVCILAAQVQAKIPKVTIPEWPAR